ncbi:xylulokinase [Streptobacillus canis]|uniref:xylulokinase n=1 Tax=Streptobacillus canis TaxID=2678686 RepID=UPI0012E29C9B|nr:xylulokinase [Streptobacillus canis]
MKYLIGIDVGTSSTKTVLYNENLKEVFVSNYEYPLYQPQNGWAEQDPNDWKKALIYTIKDIVNNSKVDVNNIVGIGLTGQMHGLVMLDSNYDVIRPSIIWADQRTSLECIEITNKVGAEKLIEITANPALPGFTASKIMWIKNNEIENYNKCKKILLPKDYIRFIMSDVFATDVSDASGMQLLDVPNRRWSNEILEILDIDIDLLADVYESNEIVAYTSKKFFELTGLKEGIPIIAGAGDNAAAAVGMGVIKENEAFTTIGTSGVVFAPINTPIIDKKGRVHTFCAAIPNTWHVMGVTQAAGLSLSYMRNLFFGNKDFSEITSNLDKIEIGADKLIYLPYLMGERTPHLDSECRGVYFGISAKHDKNHFVRSTIEGISYSLKNCLDVIEEMGIKVDEMKLTGGGSKNKIWSKMLADIFNKNILIANNSGTTLGVALLVADKLELISLNDYFEKNNSQIEKFIPNKMNYDKYMKVYQIYNELYISLKEQFKKLSQL